MWQISGIYITITISSAIADIINQSKHYGLLSDTGPESLTRCLRQSLPIIWSGMYITITISSATAGITNQSEHACLLSDTGPESLTWCLTQPLD